MRRLSSLIVNLVLAVLALGAAGWATVLIRGGATTTTTKVASSTRTVTVSRGTVTSSVSADGTVDPATTAEADFATSGTVTAIYAKVGDKVTKGQLLATVDPASADRALDLADADLTAAQDELSRATDAGDDTTTATNAVATAELTVDSAQADVDGTKLTAPMAGTITAVNGTVGSSASGSSSSSSGSTGGQGGGTSGSSTSSSTASSSGFMAIADLTDLQVSADFSESDAISLKNGQTASISWSALTGTTATGQLLSIDPSATTSESVVSYGTLVSLDKLPSGTKPGQSVTVTVTTGTASDALMVNSAAITVSGTGTRRPY